MFKVQGLSRGRGGEILKPGAGTDGEPKRPKTGVWKKNFPVKTQKMSFFTHLNEEISKTGTEEILKPTGVPQGRTWIPVPIAILERTYFCN
jgi:hypothetical protein